MATLPAKIDRPPRTNDPEDWRDWAEQVERVLNLLLTQTATWGTISNVSIDRAYDANATSLDEISDVLGTLVSDLKAKGILR